MHMAHKNKVLKYFLLVAQYMEVNYIPMFTCVCVCVYTHVSMVLGMWYLCMCGCIFTRMCINECTDLCAWSCRPEAGVGFSPYNLWEGSIIKDLELPSMTTLARQHCSSVRQMILLSAEILGRPAQPTWHSPVF